MSPGPCGFVWVNLGAIGVVGYIRVRVGSLWRALGSLVLYSAANRERGIYLGSRLFTTSRLVFMRDRLSSLRRDRCRRVRSDSTRLRVDTVAVIRVRVGSLRRAQGSSASLRGSSRAQPVDVGFIQVRVG